VDDVLEHHSMRLALTDLPGDPADEAMDRVRVPPLGQRELMTPSIELVAPVLQPVWPWNQQLTPACPRHFVDPIAVDDVPALDGVRPQAAADLDDDHPLVLEHELALLA
jgi:hypothetical protein